MLIEFDRAVENEAGQEVTIRCDEMIEKGGTGTTIETYDVGNPADEPEMQGVFEPREDGGRTYRWFGRKVRIHLADPDGYDFWGGLKMLIDPVTTDPPLHATVYAERTNQLVFDQDGWHYKHFPVR
ncbi:MAG: hypothetical protein ABEH91_05705 [Halopenitus sp.]